MHTLFFINLEERSFSYSSLGLGDGYSLTCYCKYIMYF